MLLIEDYVLRYEIDCYFANAWYWDSCYGFSNYVESFGTVSTKNILEFGTTSVLRVFV